MKTNDRSFACHLSIKVFKNTHKSYLRDSSIHRIFLLWIISCFNLPHLRFIQRERLLKQRRKDECLFEQQRSISAVWCTMLSLESAQISADFLSDALVTFLVSAEKSWSLTKLTGDIWTLPNQLVHIYSERKYPMKNFISGFSLFRLKKQKLLC